MPRKYVYVKMTEDYAGHKKDEIVRLTSKVPPHMEDYVDKATENMYTKYVKEQTAAKRQAQTQTEPGDPQDGAVRIDEIVPTTDEVQETKRKR